MNAQSPGYSLLAAFATLLALIVVMIGAFTRLSDAGLGCPDWPGCYGHLTVPQTQTEVMTAEQHYQQPVVPTKAWKEMVHRYFAGSLGALIAVLMVWGITRKRFNAGQPIAIPIVLVLLLLFQALLGMWTVTWKVQPLVVTAHLLGGMAIAGLLWYLTLATRPRATFPKKAPEFKFWSVLGLVIIIIQLFLGAWTSTNYAAIICPDFPTCQGQLFPHFDFPHAFSLFQTIGINYEGGVLGNSARVTIHMMHRYWAFVTAVYILILSICLMCSQKEKRLRMIGVWLIILLSVQVFLGIANVIWLLPIKIAVAHNGMAALLLLAIISLIFRVFYKPDLKTMRPAL